MALLSHWLDRLTAAAALTLLHLIVTGGLHIDGLADYADAIASGKRGEEAVRVMRDPCTGGVGAAAVAATLIAKTVGLAAATAPEILVAYIAATQAVYTTARISRPAPTGVARTFITKTQEKPIAANLAALAAALAPPALAAPQTLPLTLAAAIIPVLVAHDAAKRIGYTTGDILGFTYETTHTITLLAAAATPP